MIRINRVCLAVIQAGFLAALTALSAAAQSPEEAEPISVESDSEVGVASAESAAPPRRVIDEIVVTATKREKSVRDIPVSIDAFTGTELENRGAVDLEEILKYSPGVQINQDGEGENAQVTIRGINTSTLGDSRGRTFGVFLEDTSVLNPSFRGPQPQFDPFDMRTVEILKGPQGTLFGGSALAGAIRYVPNAADTEGSYGSAGLGASRIDHSFDLSDRFAAMYNWAINDRVALRVAGTAVTTAGYVDDLRRQLIDINSGGSNTGRILLNAQLMDNLFLSATHLERRWYMDDGRRLSGPQNRYVVENRRDSDVSNSTVKISGLKLEWDLDPFSVVALANRVDKVGYVHTDISLIVGALGESFVPNVGPFNAAALADGANEGDLINELDLHADTPSFELRLVSNAPTGGWLPLRNWDYLLGLYHTASDQLYYQNVTGGPGAFVPLPPDLANALGIETNQSGEIEPNAYIFIFDGVTTEQAVFFDLTRVLPGAVELSLGGRFFEIRPDVRILTAAGDETEPMEEPNTEGEELLPTERGFNPKIAATWQPGDRYSVFAAAAKGFRYGGVNSRAVPVGAANPYPLTFESDNLWNYEIGVRSDWLEGRMQADLTAFYIDWTGLQISQNYNEGFVYIDNVGAARSKGIEASTRVLLPWGLSVIANGAYMDARTKEFFSGDSGDAEKGTRLPAAPYLSSSVIASWSGLARDWKISGNFAWTYQTDSKAQLLSSARIASYSTYSMGVKLSAPNKPLQPEIALNITNLLDDYIVLYESSSLILKVAGSPRVATLGLTLHFGQ